MRRAPPRGAVGGARRARRLPALALAAAVAGCGLQVQLPDLFAITRTGEGTRLTVVVNDSGTIRCDGGKPRPISSSTLIQARDLADELGGDASRHLALPPPPGSVFTYRIRMPQGTISFADRDAGRRPELARAVLFTLRAAQGPCDLSG